MNWYPHQVILVVNRVYRNTRKTVARFADSIPRATMRYAAIVRSIYTVTPDEHARR
jgi:hypothetical protein